MGRGDKFFGLLEASAQEARTSAQALVKLSKTFDQPAVLDEFAGEADRHMLSLYKHLFNGKHEPMQVMALKDLYELLEKIIDR